MDDEYVALIWKTHNPEWDIQFMDEKADLVRQGWRDHIEAPHATGIVGGACIMRKPKDTPRMWTESGLKAFVRKLFDEDAVLRGGWAGDDSDKECPQCGKWLDPAMSCCPHCLAIKI